MLPADIDKRVEEYKTTGLDYWREGNMTKALEYFEKAIAVMSEKEDYTQADFDIIDKIEQFGRQYRYYPELDNPFTTGRKIKLGYMLNHTSKLSPIVNSIVFYANYHDKSRYDITVFVYSAYNSERMSRPFAYETAKRLKKLGCHLVFLPCPMSSLEAAFHMAKQILKRKIDILIPHGLFWNMKIYLTAVLRPAPVMVYICYGGANKTSVPDISIYLDEFPVLEGVGDITVIKDRRMDIDFIQQNINNPQRIVKNLEAKFIQAVKSKSAIKSK